MKPIEFKGKTYNNWKDYFLDKFADKEIFEVEQLNLDDNFLESYRVTSKLGESETEIIFQMHIDRFKYLELFDVYFNNPKSPKLENDNESNYGFDGQGSTFNVKHLKEIDEWIDIPVSKGWIETTTYFDEKEIKTECTWIQDNKSIICPIDQKYLDNYGCFLFPIIPLKIFLTDIKLKKNPGRVKVVENVVEPMVNK
ncbi:hypothetical protein R3X25_11625 [Lutibacter sp. TH_r2]|uniref:hypothetical protein n=1 Tax=Lutibacter sp. TH_r2 TaxID=3082083 RepID=UPI002954D134|nr:hypothetical protein [Lutibacter sp. TH_r2]MDV7187932.1 hypothetical protein [Lutibacter sp. TH_r2]